MLYLHSLQTFCSYIRCIILALNSPSLMPCPSFMGVRGVLLKNFLVGAYPGLRGEYMGTYENLVGGSGYFGQRVDAVHATDQLVPQSAGFRVRGHRI